MAPKNYSSYAGPLRKVDPSLTRTEIYTSMQRSIRLNRYVVRGVEFLIGVSSEVVLAKRGSK